MQARKGDTYPGVAYTHLKAWRVRGGTWGTQGRLVLLAWCPFCLPHRKSEHPLPVQKQYDWTNDHMQLEFKVKIYLVQHCPAESTNFLSSGNAPPTVHPYLALRMPCPY